MPVSTPARPPSAADAQVDEITSEYEYGYISAAEKSKRFIENFSENITLDKLAEITHVNKYYLSHTFQREYNTSPINYLLNRRITESKALLTSTDFSLTQISEQMGFSSPAYFSQSFRRFTGQSPLEYRRKNQPGKK